MNRNSLFGATTTGAAATGGESVSLKSVIAAVEKAKRLLGPDRAYMVTDPLESRFMGARPFFGMRIQVARENIVPKIRLGESAPVSDEFRAEFNDWLLQMFGARDMSLVKHGEAICFGNTIVMRRADIMRIAKS